jgi:hypothetical protein
MSPPTPKKPLGRTAILLLTMAADIVGIILIVFVLPLAWTTRLIVLAIYLTAVNAVSRLCQRRAAGG